MQSISHYLSLSQHQYPIDKEEVLLTVVLSLLFARSHSLTLPPMFLVESWWLYRGNKEFHTNRNPRYVLPPIVTVSSFVMFRRRIVPHGFSCEETITGSQAIRF